MSSKHRLTLIARHDDCCHAGWVESTSFRRLVHIDNGPLLPLAMTAALAEQTLDTERVIIDRSACAETFLQLLATLPHEFAGDVLRIDERGRGYLSVTGRGGDRVLHALEADDIRFYLDIHGLVRCDGAACWR